MDNKIVFSKLELDPEFKKGAEYLLCMSYYYYNLAKQAFDDIILDEKASKKYDCFFQEYARYEEMAQAFIENIEFYEELYGLNNNEEKN